MMRRLPVYLLIDVSGSMRGEPIQAVYNGMQILLNTLRQNPHALESVFLSVITFGPTAQQVVPLTELIQFQIPKLEADGVGTSLGAALKLLSNKFQSEVQKSTSDSKGDWKPITFIMTDGEPTDDFEIQVEYFKKNSTGMIVACAAGQDANTIALKMITDNVIELATLDSNTAKAYFKWVSDSIGFTSQRVEVGKVVGSLDELPPLPKEITKSVNLRKGNAESKPIDKQRALNKDKLEKRLQKEAPQLLSLANKLSTTLEYKNLNDEYVKVSLVMDASGSMAFAYSQGKVQAVLDRMVLLAASMDDDGELETWFYASKFAKFPDISIENVANYLSNNIKSGFMSVAKGLGIGNNEPIVMNDVINRNNNTNKPLLIVFITDGGIYKTDEIKDILIRTSNMPLFWQFVGLAGKDYGVLEDLDSMKGREVDNAGFFHVDDLTKIDDSELYNRLLSKFPNWLNHAKRKGIVTV